jgi:hypothetical protein
MVRLDRRKYGMKATLDFELSKLTSITKLELAKQARFAAAQTLTGAAFDVRDRLQRLIPMWIKTTRPFLQRSVIVQRATRIKLEAIIGFHKRADFTKLLEKGGTRRPLGRAISIPVGEQIKRRRTQNTIRQLLSQPNTFSGTISGVAGVWRRRGKRIKLLFAYEPSTTYDPNQIHFHETVRLIAPRYVRQHLWRNLQEAIKTRK